MSALDKEFWLIILHSWTFGELDILTAHARDLEKEFAAHV